MLSLKRALLVLWILMLGGCAAVQSDFEKPQVSVTSFRSVPSEGMAPRFLIGLHIVNPNREAISLQGISYQVSLEGRKLLNGVANNLPDVPAYGEADFSVTATADLLNGFRLLTDLLQSRRDSVNYELTARLDLGSYLPYVNVLKSGVLNLGRL
ncbi:LEA type 2 family protein [Marinobacterium sedimentorum]|uniref:LEA type 2 family protein n=1 Tax=Marinobacterium sedimentorum TaxID=2927804 RepID=UPI0020C5B7F6|nr:LEA type 2 family protein [Marinobacterium sedimentorum]MCP8690277.1 LEA type 2 family protein [Marinobacterium sedimentorum]